jgi:hypothetical protein
MRLSLLAFIVNYIRNSLTSRGVKSGSVVNMTAGSRRGRVKLLGVAIDVVLTSHFQDNLEFPLTKWRGTSRHKRAEAPNSRHWWEPVVETMQHHKLHKMLMS